MIDIITDIVSQIISGISFGKINIKDKYQENKQKRRNSKK